MLPDLTQYMWILWLALVFLFVIIELVTLEFTFLMLAAGTLVGGLGVNLAGGPWWLQIAAAAVLSALLLFTIRPLLLRVLRHHSKPVATNVDAIYGMGGRVSAPFTGGTGSVKLDNGETWTAKLTDGMPDSAVPLGSRISVSAVLGATVEVAPAPAPAPPAPDERSADDG